MWLCECDCGNECVICNNSLQRGNTKSCGCARKKDLIGKRFGRWTVLKHSHAGKFNKHYWFCKCECGTERVVEGGSLKEGKTKSCGCGIRGSNNINWNGGVTPFGTNVRKSTKGKKWIVDIYEKDNYTCKKCGKIGCKLQAHHIKNFTKIMRENKIKKLEDANKCNELWNINNGITFCKECHRKFHGKYGMNNNKKQIKEYIKENV